ncbi:hypothetical protein GE107_21945 [Cohnella sp. CFH 77786]|uniref:hypothetical protein n=1 Tax=Cohnella sp. CFH 77786 TaxID=2662265 RepID=UPI001C60F8E6|nr:hypothetical protein [Cohnella sp. CFH 77786]MBW5448710.1 hypothetical protein [Cohnella sp. CFH 77786]
MKSDNAFGGGTGSTIARGVAMVAKRLAGQARRRGLINDGESSSGRFRGVTIDI